MTSEIKRPYIAQLREDLAHGLPDDGRVCRDVIAELLDAYDIVWDLYEVAMVKRVELEQDRDRVIEAMRGAQRWEMFTPSTGTAPSSMVTETDGDWVKYADIRASLATPPAPQPCPTCERVRDWVRENLDYHFEGPSSYMKVWHLDIDGPAVAKLDRILATPPAPQPCTCEAATDSCRPCTCVAPQPVTQELCEDIARKATKIANDAPPPHLPVDEPQPCPTCAEIVEWFNDHECRCPVCGYKAPCATKCDLATPTTEPPGAGGED